MLGLEAGIEAILSDPSSEYRVLPVHLGLGMDHQSYFAKETWRLRIQADPQEAPHVKDRVLAEPS